MSARIRLPRTEFDVSPICLGGNRLGGELDQAASFALLDAYVGAGGNFIDSAHVYANWLAHVERSSSEKTIGRWLKARGYPKGLVIATKCGSPDVATPHIRRLDEASIRQDANEALENLGVDSIDILYLHRDDPDRPVEEMIGVLEALVAEKKIKRYAASNWSIARLEEAEAVCKARGWRGFVASQCEWSMAARNPGSTGADMVQGDAAMFEFHKRTGIAAIPYSSQAKGWFDKALDGRDDPVAAKAYDNPQNRDLAKTLGAAAKALGATPTQVMLKRMMAAPFPFIPIIGPRGPAQMLASLKALDLPDVSGRVTFP